MVKLFKIVDSISIVLSNAVSLLFLPMTLISVYEVAMRYLFNRPTVWAWDVNIQIFSIIVVFGSASTLLHKSHVIMDIFISRFAENTQVLIRAFVYLVFIFTVGIVAWETAIFAWRSVLLQERESTLLAAPVFPLKIGIFLGVTLLWVQGSCLWLKDVMQIRAQIRGKEKA